MSGNPQPEAHPDLGGAVRHCVVCGAPLERRVWAFDGTEQLCCTRPGCTHVHFLDPKVATGVIPTFGGKAILLQRAHNPGKGLWTFPGGYVNQGEVVQKAAAREALEEAAVEVRVGALLGVYSFDQYPTILIAFAGEVVSGEPRAAAESTALRLVGAEEIPFGDLAFDTTRAAMRDWEEWMRTGRVSGTAL